MKKLRLNMDELRVATFTTGGDGEVRGTVQGHYGTNHTEQTCGDTCINTCTQTALYTWCEGVQCY